MILVIAVMMMVATVTVNAQRLTTRQASRQAKEARKFAREDAVLAKNIGRTATELSSQREKIQSHLDNLIVRFAKANSDSAQTQAASTYWTEAAKLEAARNKIVYDNVTDTRPMLTCKEKEQYFNGIEVEQATNSLVKSKEYLACQNGTSSGSVSTSDSVSGRAFIDYEGTILNERGCTADVRIIPISGGERKPIIVTKNSSTKLRLTPGRYQVKVYVDGYQLDSDNICVFTVPSPTGAIVDGKMTSWWIHIPRW